MLEKIKKYRHHRFVQELRDIRLVGFVVFGILVLLVSWSGVRVIETNYDLQKQVSQIQQENQVAELENINLKLQNEYYNTDQYLELQARKQFSKGLAGEKLLLVPKSVALANTVDVKSPEVADAIVDTTRKPLYQRNLESWRDFLSHSRTN